MKKISFAFIITSLLIISWACKKSSNTPSVGFTVSALDSVKVSTLDTLTMDSVIQYHWAGFFVPVQPNTPTSVYQKTLYFTNTGGADFTVVYTGDTTATTSAGVTTYTSHVYLTNPSNDSTILYLGYNFSTPIISHTYANSGSYTVTVVSSNVKNYGSDVYRGVLSQVYIIK